MTAFDALRATVPQGEPAPGFVERLRVDVTAALAPGVDLPARRAATDIAAITDTVDRPSAALVPYLAVRDAAAAIDWYGAVFGGRELVRYTADDGRIGHAELDIDGARVMLSDEYLDVGAASPQHLGGTSVALNLDVTDVDAVFARAAAGGAVVRMEPTDQPYGARSCRFVDPWGHRWMVQTTIAAPTVAEINATMEGYTVTVTDPGDASTDSDTEPDTDDTEH